MLLVVTIQIYSCKFGACPIFGDGIMFLEDIPKLMGVVFTNISNNKFIYDEIEIDGAPFVTPSAQNGDRLVVARSIEAFGEDIIGELAIFQKAVDVFACIEVYPPVTRKLVEIVFENKFIRYI